MDLRFECQPGCTKCCDMEGMVYLSEDDVTKAARFLHMKQANFEAKYIYRTRHQRRFRKPRNKQCPFLGKTGCEIHPAKPTHCLTYPFLPEIVERLSTWRATGKLCPGIGKGPLIQIGTAMEIADEQRKAYPDMYRR